MMVGRYWEGEIDYKTSCPKCDGTGYEKEIGASLICEYCCGTGYIKIENIKKRMSKDSAIEKGMIDERR